MNTIREIDLDQVNLDDFAGRFVGCIVLTQDNKFLLQEIVDARPFFPAGSVTTFGGRIEVGETPLAALIRELNEELGAAVQADDVTYLGAVTESVTGHSELIYAYYWQDELDTLTGCYEDRACYFDCAQDVVSNPHVTDDVTWMLSRLSRG